MNRLTTKFDATTGESNGTGLPDGQSFIDSFAMVLIKFGILKEDLDYHLIRASMVIIFLFFGYQKWFQYEADVLIPYISNGPLIFWLCPVFGIRRATWFLGISEWSLARCCSWDSGIKNWECSGPSAHVLRSSVPLRLFHFYRMAGPYLPAVSRR
jgi:hypothetical protein